MHIARSQKKSSRKLLKCSYFISDLFQIWSLLQFDIPVKRPSGIILDYDEDRTPIIYVLSLWAKAVYKFKVRNP